MSEAFYVFFKDGPPKDWMRAADIVTKAGAGFGIADAKKACRFGQGLLPVPLTQEKAQAVSKALNAAALEAFCMPVSKIVELNPVYNARAGTPDASGFNVTSDTQGEPQLLPWDAVRVINVAYVKPGRVPPLPKEPVVLKDIPGLDDLPDERSQIAGPAAAALGMTMASIAVGVALGPRVGALGMRIMKEETGLEDAREMGPAPLESQPQKSEPEVWLELFALEPFMRLRIRQRVFRYDYLGARRMPNVRGNFKLLTMDVMKFAPHAARVHQAAQAATGAAIDQDRFLIEEAAHELSLTALITREWVHGLPR